MLVSTELTQAGACPAKKACHTLCITSRPASCRDLLCLLPIYCVMCHDRISNLASLAVHAAGQAYPSGRTLYEQGTPSASNMSTDQAAAASHSLGIVKKAAACISSDLMRCTHGSLSVHSVLLWSAKLTAACNTSQNVLHLLPPFHLHDQHICPCQQQAFSGMSLTAFACKVIALIVAAVEATSIGKADTSLIPLPPLSIPEQGSSQGSPAGC